MRACEFAKRSFPRSNATGRVSCVAFMAPLRGRRLDVSTCAGCDDVTAAHLRPELELRLGYRKPGLTMRAVGGRGTRKLQDIFVDARVPREDRDTWPLVFAGDSLAFVPGIAVSADLASRRGEPSLHVTVSGIPAKVESLNSLPGVPT